MWFAFKLVSLNHWEQFYHLLCATKYVVICFQISIFEPFGTIRACTVFETGRLWFAFKLVSLNHWEQLLNWWKRATTVVICFQISIFEPLGTITTRVQPPGTSLWFAFKLVSLNHWEQSDKQGVRAIMVVICFQISIFEPLGTIRVNS